MAMPEGKILICRAVNSPGYVVPGSLPMGCQECNKIVWVSPSGLLLRHDNPEMQIKCMTCAFAHMASHGGTLEDLCLPPGVSSSQYLLIKMIKPTPHPSSDGGNRGIPK